MHISRFDALSRALAVGHSRRNLTRLLTFLGVAGALSPLVDASQTMAKKRRRRKKKHGQDPGPSNGSTTTPPPCTCRGGTCTNGQCVCPYGSPCPQGVCCATGEYCAGESCAACAVGAEYCQDTTQLCGATPGGKPCYCATSVHTVAYCAAPPSDLVHCSDCALDTDCDNELGVGQGVALCVAGCSDVCAGSGQPNLCLIKGCIDV
jgi:hypothetical protein